MKLPTQIEVQRALQNEKPNATWDHVYWAINCRLVDGPTRTELLPECMERDCRFAARFSLSTLLGVIGPSSASRQRTRDPAFGAHVSLSARAGPTGVGEVPCLARRHRLIVYGRGASAAKSTCVPMCNVCIISYHPVQWSRRGHLLWHLTGLSSPPLATIGGRLWGIRKV